MLLIAHRGLSAHYPENTEQAFTKAIDAGAKAIECDVHQVGDTFVIYHDYQLQRLSEQSGYLTDLSPSELSELRVHSTHKVLTLEQFFALIDTPILINLEIKALENTQAFIEALCRCAKEHPAQIVLSSFNHPLLVDLQQTLRDTHLDNHLRLGALIAHLPLDNDRYFTDVIRLGAQIAAIDAHLVDQNFVKQAHLNDLEVWCYTVNDERLLRLLYSFGVDGIFTDDVTWAQAALNQAD
ncbi:glycerophosphodiester phosphodiesterase [Glaciecola sp. XM2]|jgi:glycerophosphoryl diester phosphodiesterase|uniref:glycerophosphodiester phosphodiesterase n=1 Tax=Glaciecola sp. XM2 TaxID=1914931 RepID=UPI001BDE652E|nr:glycerophosphodiester phosphodiesterase [Glaciecola sp. XM2]MBT1450196.1 glycerophosphodiester phosphodiesterase [Glaciecola sp. XM2]